MKKFVVLGVAVCAAVAAQAASFTWVNVYEIKDTDGVYTGGGTAYLIDGAVGHGGISQSALFNMIKGGEAVSWNTYTFYSATLGTDGKSFMSVTDTTQYPNSSIDAGSAKIGTPTAKATYEYYTAQIPKQYSSEDLVSTLTGGDFYSVLVTGDGNYYFSEVTSVNVSGEGTTEINFNNANVSEYLGTGNLGGWYNVAPVPEPTSGLLMLVGLSLLGLRRKRRE